MRLCGQVKESQISETVASRRDCLPLEKEGLIRDLELTSKKILCERELASCLPKVALALRGERVFLEIKSKD